MSEFKIACLLSGRDVACVQRYFANARDERCMHGRTMRQNCDDCRRITGQRDPDSLEYRVVRDEDEERDRLARRAATREDAG